MQPQNYGLIHVNMTTCLLPSFITIVVATLHLESQHASNLKKEKYLDVHLNWLILRALEWVHGGLSNINSSHARKYIANKLVLMYLQTFVKIHLGYKA